MTNNDIQLSDVVYHVTTESDDSDDDPDKKEAGLLVPKSPPRRRRFGLAAVDRQDEQAGQAVDRRRLS